METMKDNNTPVSGARVWTTPRIDKNNIAAYAVILDRLKTRYGVYDPKGDLQLRAAAYALSERAGEITIADLEAICEEIYNQCSSLG